jgi:predicted phosphodiesterase
MLMIYQRKDVVPSLEDKIIELYIKGLKPIEIQELTGVCIPTIMVILDPRYSGYENNKMVSFKTEGKSILIIADTHIGHKDENFKYIDEAYETGIKNNVSCCIHLGDLIEGELLDEDAPIDVQMEEVMDYYPELDDFYTFLTMGNHDFYVFDEHKNYLRMLESKKGLKVLGYKRTYFDWNNYIFGCEHKIAEKYFPDDFLLEQVQHYFVGHGHELKQKTKLRLKAPTLSDNIINQFNGAYPAFLIANLEDNYLHVDVYNFKDNKARIKKKDYLLKEMVKFKKKK